MRIRFLSAFEPGWSFYRDLLPFLAKQGVEIELVISNAEYRGGRSPLDEALSHSRIRVSYVPVGKVEVGVERAWIYLAYIAGAIVRTLFGQTADLNFFITQPPLFSIWGYILKVLRQQRYCILVMDLYPDVAVQGDLLPSTALSTRLLNMVSRFVLRRADIVIALGRCMEERLHREGVPPQRTYVIPNWANAKVYPIPHHDNQLRRELGLEEDFIVLYSGNIGFSHFFDDLLEVARRLRKTRNLRFVFVGDGVRRKEIKQAKETHNLSNILLLPFQPVERIAQSLSMGDVHFISLRPGFEGLVVPSKTYSALAAGRAVIYQGNPHGEIARMVAEEQIGLVVPPYNSDALERAILHYYRNPAIVAGQGKRAYELAQGRFSCRNSLEKYGSVLVGS